MFSVKIVVFTTMVLLVTKVVISERICFQKLKQIQNIKVVTMESHDCLKVSMCKLVDATVRIFDRIHILLDQIYKSLRWWSHSIGCRQQTTVGIGCNIWSA